MTEITNEKEKLQSLFANFQKALGRLEETIKLPPTSVHKDATIQRFEFTFELAWKLMQSTTKYQGFESKSPRESIRVATQLGLIYDPEEWFEFLEARNLTTHTYNEPVADEVYQKAKEFLKTAKDFCEEVKKQTKWIPFAE